MTIHLVGLPHTQFDDKAFSSCAFTAKAVRLKRMIESTGRKVASYWGGDMADVSLLSTDEQSHFFGEWSPEKLPVIEWGSALPYWKLFHQRAITEISKRIKPGDMVAIVAGSTSQAVVDEFKDRYLCLEPGVGYEGLARSTFACFESYAWMHNRYGAHGIQDGRSFDTVIPNAVDPNEWTLAPSKRYALFVGRLISRKGPNVAAQIADRVGLPLVLAGGGVYSKEPGRIIATDGTVISGNVEHVGAVAGEARRKLFAEAEVLICPTLYIGPWEGVHAEAMMSGVGVVAPDYGVFTETLDECFRYTRMSEALSAISVARETRGMTWRQKAIDLCGIDVCTDKYDRWLSRLETIINGNGWYD